MMVLRDTPQTSFFGPEVRRSLQLNINNVQSHGKSLNPLLKNILPGIDFTFNFTLFSTTLLQVCFIFLSTLNSWQINGELRLVCVFAEWEAVKSAEQAKDVISQQASAETTAASNSQTDPFNQQVAMMPVQVLKSSCQLNHPTVVKEWTTLSKLSSLARSSSQWPRLFPAESV